MMLTQRCLRIPQLVVSTQWMTYTVQHLRRQQMCVRSAHTAMSHGSLARAVVQASLRLRTVSRVPLNRGIKTKGGRDRKGLAPVDEIDGATRGFRDLFKPFCFTVLVSGCSYIGAAIWQYESMRKRVAEARNPMRDIHSRSSFVGKAGEFRQMLNTWWNNQSAGEKIIGFIIGINFGIFTLWRVVPMQRLMLKYFTSSPVSGAPCWSMLLSTFSHYSLWHVAANMYVLWSFGPVATKLFGGEQFVATYITAGMVSSFASYAIKIARKSRVPSVGASGAIMGLIGAVCISHPDAQLSVAFVDQIFPHSFSASTGMAALITLDVAGILFGWRLFDHAAHLGGMLFGIWYVKYGSKMIWGRREIIMKKWHDLRGGV